MRKSTHAAIRSTLLAHPDGLTASQIADITDLMPDTIRQALASMPDAYIDRWERPAKTKGYKGKTWRAVYIAVPIPPNTPKPA